MASGSNDAVPVTRPASTARMAAAGSGPLLGTARIVPRPWRLTVMTSHGAAMSRAIATETSPTRTEAAVRPSKSQIRTELTAAKMAAPGWTRAVSPARTPTTTAVRRPGTRTRRTTCQMVRTASSIPGARVTPPPWTSHT